MTALAACLIAIGAFFLPEPARGSPEPTNTGSPPPRELNKRKAAEGHARDIRQYGSNSNFLVRPGLLADRAARRIAIAAESVRLADGSPAEFALIGENSGKDYEALAVSFALPSAVHEALLFIGLQPGRGVDPAGLRFWPKGERVKVIFRYSVTEKSAPRDVPVEELVLDTRTGAALPRSGFAFTGSSWGALPNRPGTNQAYTADVFSPNSIVSLYNESGTVLDVPRRAAQHEVYSYQVPDPSKPLPKAQLIEVIVEPENKDGRKRVRELELALQPAPSASNSSGLCYALRDGETPLNTNTTQNGLQAALQRLKDEQLDAFVTVMPNDDLPLSSMQQASTLLDSMENTAAIRIEPPPPGHPFYKAFLPDERHRERSGRPIQPWELHLGSNAGGATGELALVEEEWKEGESKPAYHEIRFALPSPAELAPLLQRKESPLVMLVFAPADLRYGTLRDFIKPVIERQMILYVFLPRADLLTPGGKNP